MSRSHADHTRHLADRARESGDADSLYHFLRIDRAQEVHPAIRALHARSAPSAAEGGLAPFLHILRGHLT
jgi:hypothetical protein